MAGRRRGLDNEFMRVPFSLPLLLALLLTACGGDEEPAEPPPQEVLERAVAAVGQLRTFHFKLTHENGATPMPLNLQLTTAEGDFVAPDRLAAEVKAKAGPVSASVKVIAIGERTWITNPFSRAWQTLNASARDIADPRALVEAVVGGLQGVALDGRSDVNGAETYHLKGTLPSEALRSALSVARPGRTLAVDLWIGVEDGLPRRARLSGPLATGEAENIVRQIDFSAFDESVEIRAPS